MTSYQEVIDLFFRRVERDRDFFLYVGQTPEESMALAQERAMGYLTEALAMLVMNCHPTVDFFAHPEPEPSPAPDPDTDQDTDQDDSGTDPSGSADAGPDGDTSDNGGASTPDVSRMFAFDLSLPEKLLVSSLMYRQHLDRDISYLKTLSRDYTATDLRVFSPSEARDSFMNMYGAVCAECDRLMDLYRNTDRETFQLIGIDFAAYDTEG